MSRRTAIAFLGVLAVLVMIRPGLVRAQQQSPSQQPASDEIMRRAKTKVWPDYPDLARRMNITGSVKIQVVVSPNGTVKDARIVGGHPLLATAALEAAKKWRFEPAPAESSGVIDFKFEPR